MPVKNEGESDGEGYVSDRSDRSNSSQQESSADEPDSDDSSEMDESECEKRRLDCIDNLANLERQFTILREQLYRERINQVDIQLSEVRVGRSQEYLGPLQQLDDNLKTRLEVAEVLKKFRLENIEHKFVSEQLAAMQHFESEKLLAVDQIYEELMEKVRRLEEDRHNVDISLSDWSRNARTNKVRGPGRKKAVTVTGPYIVYMLHEDDILQDWTIIRKALKRSAATGST